MCTVIYMNYNNLQGLPGKVRSYFPNLSCGKANEEWANKKLEEDKLRLRTIMLLKNKEVTRASGQG